jgi:LEA14-like dessication related protein
MALCAAFAGSGCSTLRQLRFQQPTIQLETVEITSLGREGGTFDLWLDVFNPNSYDLRATRVEAALDLEETHFGSAALEEDVVLTSTEHSRVVVPVTFTWEGVGAAARSLLERGSVSYDMEASMWLGGSLGNRRVVLRHSGEAPIKDAYP